jgi:polyhydroxybutyrate depolymerase
VVRNRGETISTDEIIRKWVTANKCAGDPVAIQLPDTDPSDGTRVTKTAYTACAQQSVVVLYTIEGGGHTWPGGSQYLPRGIVGRVSRDINANEVIWAFFAAHPRP